MTTLKILIACAVFSLLVLSIGLIFNCNPMTWMAIGQFLLEVIICIAFFLRMAMKIVIHNNLQFMTGKPEED